MADKSLRILIADTRHACIMQVEHMLNRLGYYRIATASTLPEARSLGRGPGQPFDLMIAGSSLIASEPLEQLDLGDVYCNGLIYESQHLPVILPGLAAEGIVTRLPGRLDSASLGMFMALIDPKAQEGKREGVLFC